MHSDFLLVSACLCTGDAARGEELCFFFFHRTEDTGTLYLIHQNLKHQDKSNAAIKTQQLPSFGRSRFM